MEFECLTSNQIGEWDTLLSIADNSYKFTPVVQVVPKAESTNSFSITCNWVFSLNHHNKDYYWNITLGKTCSFKIPENRKALKLNEFAYCVKQSIAYVNDEIEKNSLRFNILRRPEYHLNDSHIPEALQLIPIALSNVGIQVTDENQQPQS